VTDKHLRHPLKNFFVKKSIQINIIWKIIVTVIISASLTTGLIMFLYNLKSSEGSFYYMSNDMMQDLELKNIIGIVLPSIIVVEIIAILIAFGIGLISSRKIAVPIFKIEKWASKLKTGKLNTTLAFREEDHLNELTTQCNSVTDFYKTIFEEIRQHTETIANKTNDPVSVSNEAKALQQILNRIEM
jgi:methyl-accepting chemotaxis protein